MRSWSLLGQEVAKSVESSCVTTLKVSGVTFGLESLSVILPSGNTLLCCLESLVVLNLLKIPQTFNFSSTTREYILVIPESLDDVHYPHLSMLWCLHWIRRGDKAQHCWGVAHVGSPSNKGTDTLVRLQPGAAFCNDSYVHRKLYPLVPCCAGYCW